jgi:hypothetical protein
LTFGRSRDRSLVQEPGIDEHEWITEWEDLDPLLDESPLEAIADADDLIRRMMEARGFELEERDGEELTDPEITRAYTAARAVRAEIESPDPLDPGDVPAAVDAYRELYQRLLDYGATPGAPA